MTRSQRVESVPIATDGTIVIIDAMGCQRDIEKKANDVLALKGNQTALHKDVKMFVAEQQARGFADTTVSGDTRVDGDRGRIETRTTTVPYVDWLQRCHNWPGLVVAVQSTREIASKIEQAVRLYITSLVLPAGQLGPIVRSHRTIENSLHWVIDMIFRDDEGRMRTDHGPANVTTLRHMAHNLLHRPAGKDSLRVRRKVAAWDDDFLASLVSA